MVYIRMANLPPKEKAKLEEQTPSINQTERPMLIWKQALELKLKQKYMKQRKIILYNTC